MFRNSEKWSRSVESGKGWPLSCFAWCPTKTCSRPSRGETMRGGSPTSASASPAPSSSRWPAGTTSPPWPWSSAGWRLWSDRDTTAKGPRRAGWASSLTWWKRLRSSACWGMLKSLYKHCHECRHQKRFPVFFQVFRVNQIPPQGIA